MNLLQESHPANDLLAAYSRGDLDDDQHASVETHVSGCDACCETLANLPEDTLAGLLREGSEGAAPEARPKASEQPTLPPSGDATRLPGEGAGTSELPAELRNHTRYHITSLLGRGGMGSVYKAEHRLMSRAVALKVISSALLKDNGAVERFRREIQAASRLNHPNIVTAYDAEQAGVAHYFVMEFVEGTDLARVVAERGPLPVEKACEYVRQAALGLAHAHEQGMVHRDIKPQNLMVSGPRGGSPGTVKLLDFGLARFASEAIGESGLTTAGAIMGTPDYMAPEQARDARSADVRADIYSLGCTLYYLLAGRVPFPSGSALEKVMAHVERRPEPISKLRGDVPQGLIDVLDKMTAKSLDDRYHTPAEVVAAMAPYAAEAGESAALAAPVAPGPAVWRKWKWPIALAAVLLPLLLIAAGVILYIATDNGTVEIDADDAEVEGARVVLIRNGEEYARFDLKPGEEQVQTIRAGNYRVELKGAPAGTELDVWSKRGGTGNWGSPETAGEPVVLYRGGGLMIRVSRREAVADAPTERRVIARFDGTDSPITKDGVSVEDGGWKIVAEGERSVALFEVKEPGAESALVFYRAQLKSEGLEAPAYLEMGVRFPGEGEYFSKGIESPLTGTTGWSEYQIPFRLEKGQRPDLIRLKVTLEGKGTVWIKDIEVRQEPLPGAVAEDEATKAKKAAAVAAAEKWLALMDAGKYGECWDQSARLNRDGVTREGMIELYQALFESLGELKSRTLVQSLHTTTLPNVPEGDYVVVQYVTKFESGTKVFQTVTLMLEDRRWRVSGHYLNPVSLPPGDGAAAEAAEPQNPAGLPAEPGEDVGQKRDAAVAAAKEWLELVDAGKYGEAWDATARLNKESVTRDGMIELYENLFKPLGKVKSRTLAGSNYTTTVRRAPEGEYVLVQFVAELEDGGKLTELVTPMLEEDGVWRVSGYQVNVQPGRRKPAEKDGDEASGARPSQLPR